MSALFNPYYQYQAPQPMQNNQPQYMSRGMVKGRPVASVDEVRAAQADFDGSISYFPCVAEGAIYTKFIDLNGMPLVQRYVLERPAQEDKVVTVSMLEQRISDLMKGMQNVQSNAVNANATSQQQSATDAAAAIR